MQKRAPKKPNNDTEYLSTLDRGLSVLRAFGRENPQMTLSEVARRRTCRPRRRGGA